MKRGFLSKEEKEYIEQNLNLSIKDLAKDLDRSTTAVQKYINELPQEEEKSKTPFEKVMAKSTNSTVMTPSASEVLDSKRRSGGVSSKKYGNAIHRIR